MAKRVTVRGSFRPGFYAAVGRVAVAFGRVEYEIKLSVKSLREALPRGWPTRRASQREHAPSRLFCLTPPSVWRSKSVDGAGFRRRSPIKSATPKHEQSESLAGSPRD